MSTLRQFIGWYGMDEATKQTMEKHKKIVLVFPHTAYFDVFLYSLYFLESETLQKRSRVLINPNAMEQLGGVLKEFGGMKATARLVKNGGCVKRVIDELKQMDEYILLLSPKGGLYDFPWRSGYYWFAKLLGCELVAGGFDYRTKQFVVKEPFYVNDMTLEEAEARCKADLYDITPLHPHYSEFKTLCNDRECVGKESPCSVNIPWMIGLVALMIAIFLIVVMMCVWLFERGVQNKTQSTLQQSSRVLSVMVT